LVLFSLPRRRCVPGIQTFQCSNIRLDAFKAFTMRNLLWKVDFIPYNFKMDKNTREGWSGDKNLFYLAESLCNSVLEYPGHLLFNDEGDGFRLTWILARGWREDDEDTCAKPLLKLESMAEAKHPNKPNVVTEHLYEWETRFHDPQSGKRINEFLTSQQGLLSLPFSAYLSVQNLLADVLACRPSLQRSYLFSDGPEDIVFPEYFYNLVSLGERGRTAELLVVFRSRERVGAVGVFLIIDLFTQAYRELNWIRGPKVKDSSSLRSLCNSLALSQRMRRQRVGPYSVQPDSVGWGHLCMEMDSELDFDVELDSIPSLWRAHHKRAKADGNANVPSNLIPKPVSYSSLYPNCELITNRAVACAKPVLYLQGRRSPVKLVYG
jgi:hypothetical protein